MRRIVAGVLLGTLLVFGAGPWGAGPWGAGPSGAGPSGAGPSGAGSRGGGLWGGGPAHAAGDPDEATVQAIASQLRCVVCQNLSVGDSPSETANQMRAIIRQRLAAGDTPKQVIAYFVDKYGLWILLSPPRQGFNLVVWIAPIAGLLVGLAVVVVVIGRWRRQARRVPEAAPAIDQAMRTRIAREMAEPDR